MAMAIPAAIGLGTSIVGGVQGKGARKKQEKLAQQQLAQLQPFLNAAQSVLGTSRELFPQAAGDIQTVFNQATGAYEPLMKDYRSLLGRGEGMLDSSASYLSGASNALGDLQKFYRPFMFEGQSAIDRFLPSARRTNELLAPEVGNINQGYQSASENIARFAPRGGGRVSSLARGDLDRQKQLSDTFFQGRQNLSNQALGAAFQGAQGQQGIAQMLQQLGLGTGQLGLGTIGAGQNSLSQALQALGIGGSAAGGLGQLASSLFGQGMSGANILGNLYGQQAGRAYQQSPNIMDTGESLGSYLQKLFSDKTIQNTIGGLFGGGKGRNTGGLIMTPPIFPGSKPTDYAA